MLSGFPRGDWIVVLVLSVALGLAQPIRGQSGKDFSEIKGEMKVLSAVIDESMAQTFSPPFGILQKTKGAYLPDYGVVFGLEVNLYPVPLQKLLESKPVSKTELGRDLRAKKDRIQRIRQMVPRLLADHARGLREVESEEHVAVVVHLFDVRSGQEELPTQLVVEVKKNALEQYWDKKTTYDQFLKQVRIIEY